jgi:CubicO group peptidase (beta-lactamase class C family)
MLIFQLVLAAASLACVFAGAATASSQARPHPPTSAQRLDGYFSALARYDQFTGSVLVADHGRVIYEASFGAADVATGRPNTATTAFPIASITKTFTATAILQLRDQGRLRLSDPVARYLPAFPYPTITVRHLLSHTSGLPSWDAVFDSVRLAHRDTVFTNADLVAGYVAKRLPLSFQPGDRWEYQNVNFAFLGLIVEKITGRPIDEYIAQQILERAGMTHTIVPAADFYHYSSAERANLAVPNLVPHLYSDQRVDPDSIAYLARYWSNYNFRGFGEIISTPQDLLRYDQALTDGRLLNSATLHEAGTPVRLNDGDLNPAGYGLGWQADADTSLGRVVNHGGGMIGLNCILLRNFTRNQTVVLFDNKQHSSTVRTHDLALRALAILNGRAVPPPRESAARAYGYVLTTRGPAAAHEFLLHVLLHRARFSIDEDEFNALGYDLMGDSSRLHVPATHRYADAIDVFAMNSQLFPNSWNVYDSYGEALARIGRRDDAAQMYEESIARNPNNDNGRRMLADLRAGDRR